MADRYYVKAGSVRLNGGGSYTVAIRYDVPAGNNDVSVAWSTAAAESYVADGSPPTEYPGETDTLLASGAEAEMQLGFKDNVDNAGLAARLEVAVIAAIAAEKTRLQDVLRFWGKTATV